MAIILYFLILTLTTIIQFTSKQKKNQSFFMFHTCEVVQFSFIYTVPLKIKTLHTKNMIF